MLAKKAVRNVSFLKCFASDSLLHSHSNLEFAFSPRDASTVAKKLVKKYLRHVISPCQLCDFKRVAFCYTSCLQISMLSTNLILFFKKECTRQINYKSSVFRNNSEIM